MVMAFYVPLVCALVLTAIARDVSRRASPKLGAVTLVAAALTVALAADAALGALVGARLLDAAPAAALLGWRAETPGHIPVPAAVSIAAAAALVIAAGAAGTDWRSARRAQHRLRALHRSAPPGELIVLPSRAIVAQALPALGRSPGRILVSDGMLRVLDPRGRRVVLAHERSHLRHRHERYRTLVRIAARINPLLRPTVAATDLLLERWADEDAARAVGSRRLTARTLARAAVAATPPERPPELARFATAPVTTRVAALLAAEPPEGSRAALVALIALALVAIVSAGVATHELGHLFDLLRGDG